MPVRDRRYENTVQFIFGAILWVIVGYCFAHEIIRLVKHLFFHTAH